MFKYFSVNEMRTKDKEGNDLPKPRSITLNLLTSEKKLSKTVSALMGAFGQFVAHDLANTPTHQVKKNFCCDMVCILH